MSELGRFNYLKTILEKGPIILLIVSVLNEFDFNYLNLKYFSFNFPFILIYYWSLKRSGSLGYGLIFLSGLLNDVVTGLGVAVLGDATPRTFIERTPDTRNLIDTVYRARYVLPAGTGISSARPPIDGYVIQESSNVTGATDAEVATFFSPTTSFSFLMDTNLAIDFLLRLNFCKDASSPSIILSFVVSQCRPIPITRLGGL